ncbi:MAG: MerR family transcriptional regulator [Pseudomonadales bacterium]|nr:MerR family transcriptional regulator [Pseudomonadales bacterium]
MPTPPPTLTIGRLAKQAGVGVETIRYYQQRGLLPVPAGNGSYRQYPVALVERIGFIKRAQELGFSLDEIMELLQMDESMERDNIRQLAAKKAAQIQQKIDDLQRIQTTLQALVSCCANTGTQTPCPIIATLTAPQKN